MSRIKRFSAVLCALMLFLPCIARADDDDLYTGAVVKYETDTAEYGSVGMTMLGNAELTFPREANARYEGEVSASFERFSVIKDARVKKGDVIAVVRGMVSKADVERARLQLLRAQEDYERAAEANELLIQNMTIEMRATKNDTDKERARLLIEKQKLTSELYSLTALRTIKGLEENYDKLQKQDALIEILSPVDGVVKNTRDYSYGDTVSPSAVLATLYVTTDMLIQVNSRWGTPAYGVKVSIKLGTGGTARDLTGTVVAADNMLNSQDKTGKTYVRIDGGETAEYGQSLSLCFPLFAMDNVLLVDSKAVYSDGSKNYVYLLKDSARQKKYVTIAFSNSTDAWILDGLAAGDVVTLH